MTACIRKRRAHRSRVFQCLCASNISLFRGANDGVTVPIGVTCNIVDEISVIVQESLEGSKPLTAFRSFDYPNLNRREMIRAPVRSKSMLSAFFVKQKTPKMKTSSVS